MRHYPLIFILFVFAQLNGKVYASSFNAFTSSGHLAMAGAGYLYPSTIATKTNPSSFKKQRWIETSVIKYPADIISQSVGIGSYKRGYYSFALGHLSYGVFDGYDENGLYTNTYNSSSTRISGAYAAQIRRLPLFIGSKISWASTNLSNESDNALKISIGNHLVFEKIQTSIGFSLHEINIFSTAIEEINSVQLVASVSKKLVYLPLTTYFDFCSTDFLNTGEYFFGGIFNLKNGLMISFGSSSQKITQNINQSFMKTILGATGFGLSYDTDLIIIQYGNYFYGTGANASGVSIEVKF
tara:strand:- start:802 stop:1695 length:894 start_codon:yes stop_codon:yes gene_type:complete